MNISAKTDYACKALFELALHWPKKDPLAINTIAKNQGIPLKFLTHILIQLKAMGLVESVRGQHGGYLLARPPKEITVRDAVYGFAHSQVKPRKANLKEQHILSAIWEEAEEEFLNYIGKISFEHINDRERKRGKVPMYTI